jgi:transposase
MIRRPSKPDPKLRALKDSGTLNPHAQDVQDPAFVGIDFFDPRDLVQVRYEMLRRVRTDGQSIVKATTAFGVSRPTFYKVQDDFDRSGLVGLLPSKRGPRGPHKITAQVMRFIEETAASDEELDAQDLAERIAQRFGLVVHRRTVARALMRLKKKRDESRRPQPRRSSLDCALRDIAAGRRRRRKLPPYSARIGAVHPLRDGGVDEEPWGRSGVPRCRLGGFADAAYARRH